MAKKQREEGSGYNYMDTYGDMMTLLLTFFVLLFSMSSVQEEKFELLVKAFTARGGETTQIVIAPDGKGDEMGEAHGEDNTIEMGDSSIDLDLPDPQSFDELFEYLAEYVAAHDMSESIKVEKTGENTIFLRFEDNIFFWPDSEELKPESMPILEFIGTCIKNVEDKIMLVRIGGHTADPGILNYRVSDRILSTNRANAVLMYLEDQKKFDSKKLVASGYGKNYPVADNSTPEGRSKNRRVEMFIIGNEADLTSQEEMYEILENALKITVDDLDSKPQEPVEEDITQNPEKLENFETIPDKVVTEDKENSDENKEKDEENKTEDGELIPPPSEN